MNRLQAAEQLRKALQMYAQTLTDEEAMEIAAVYPAWVSGTTYKTGTMVTYGANSVGDPQLYRCLQTHTAQADWTPDASAALWTAVGLAPDDIPVWSRPTGAHDAYNRGDRVHYPTADAPVYTSAVDGNTWSPDEYPAGWDRE